MIKDFTHRSMSKLKLVKCLVPLEGSEGITIYYKKKEPKP